jgi:hypothetical protein
MEQDFYKIFGQRAAEAGGAGVEEPSGQVYAVADAYSGGDPDFGRGVSGQEVYAPGPYGYPAESPREPQSTPHVART